jgi:hypothetical protein
MLRLAAPFDLRQYFVNDGIFSKRLPEGRIQALQQLGDRFIVAAYEGDAHLLSLGGQGGAADGWYFPDRDLTAGAIEEGLNVLEGRDG